MNRCLFLDDGHIDRMDGLKRRTHPAKRYSGNPLFKKEFPWEQAWLLIYGNCTVYNSDRKLYQMYYLAKPSFSHYPNLRVGNHVKVGYATLPAYAESRDGIHWERPLREDVPYENIGETNLLDLNVGQSFEPGILWDPNDPDPKKRYKAFVWDQRFSLPKPGKLGYRRAAPSIEFPLGLITTMVITDDSGAVVYEQPHNDYGIMVSFSPDGLHWTKHPDWVMRCYSDTGQTVLYDPDLRKYVAYGRFNQQKESPAFYIGRNVARVESSDFIHWTDPELVLAADDRDSDGLQINSMPVDRYEGVYIGLMELDERPRGPRSIDPLPIQLATSRDGRHWTRVADRGPFIDDPKPGAWDESSGKGLIRPTGGLFVAGDEVRMYYCNASGPVPYSAVGMATWRRDGFVSLYAGDSGGELLTRAFIPTGPELHLNLNASQGEAMVRVCDFQGRPLKGWQVDQPSEPIRGDQLDAVVRWNRSDLDQRVGKATTLRIKLRNADLYSFWSA